MPGPMWPASAGAFLAMWTPMMLAMMLPATLVPLAWYWRTLRPVQASGARLGGFTLLAGVTYMLAWIAVGGALYPLGVAWAAARMRWPPVERFAPLAGGLVLLLAAWAQLSRWKARQLERCRNPASCLPARDTGASGAARYGLNLAGHCITCCAGFMTALVVIGLGSLPVMVAVFAAITIERLAPRPARYSLAAGLALAMAGLIGTARAVL